MVVAEDVDVVRQRDVVIDVSKGENKEEIMVLIHLCGQIKKLARFQQISLCEYGIISLERNGTMG